MTCWKCKRHAENEVVASDECLKVSEIKGWKFDYLSLFFNIWTDTENSEQKCNSRMLKCKGTVSSVKHETNILYFS